MGSGLEGIVDGRAAKVGSHQLVFGARTPVVGRSGVTPCCVALSVFVVVEGRTIGALLLADEIRRETPRRSIWNLAVESRTTVAREALGSGAPVT
jgi:cation transport ATPase